MKKIKEYFETINLGNYDLEGVEFTEDDFYIIAERLKDKNKNIEKVFDEYLCEVREILDSGLE